MHALTRTHVLRKALFLLYWEDANEKTSQCV